MAFQEQTFIGPVARNGRASLALRESCARSIAMYAGSSVRIAIGPVPRRPTARQRGYYFPVVCGLYGEFAGYTKQEAHIAFKLALLGVEAAEGRKLPRVRSITSLQPAVFRDYVEDCRRIAAEMGCQTPDPDPGWRMQGYQAEWARLAR